MDELLAVLGATLPCANYAVAWLGDPPGRIKYRCAWSAANAEALGENAWGDRVLYIVDIVASRERYMSAYRSRGTPTPAVVLAQFLSSVAALARSG